MNCESSDFNSLGNRNKCTVARKLGELMNSLAGIWAIFKKGMADNARKGWLGHTKCQMQRL